MAQGGKISRHHPPARLPVLEGWSSRTHRYQASLGSVSLKTDRDDPYGGTPEAPGKFSVGSKSVGAKIPEVRGPPSGTGVPAASNVRSRLPTAVAPPTSDISTTSRP